MATDLATEFQGMLAASYDEVGSMTAEQYEGLQAAFYGGAMVAVLAFPESPTKLHLMLQLQAYIKAHQSRHGLKKGGH
ncbi:hypothetical protein [Planctopirus hydrillae]|uniref:Uncharacterized protein n=1 Tax=Planctopirus hydrillae TaxID=1841610 RepID=A0A1C3E7N9_9PLAN|nr:hypothetical protein [Planctopirus hydrillae]ODA29241.1 hypothetical protein A6X21_09070 [Planctopirus hydrillae]